MNEILEEHINSLSIRYPKAWKAYKDNGGANDWDSLMGWTKEMGQTSRYHSIAMQKIENTI